MEDKRKFKRILFRTRVEYRSKKIWQMVEISDISCEGVFVLTRKTEPPNTPVELLFRLNELKVEVYVQGVVVWRRMESQVAPQGNFLYPGMGIKFVKVYPSIFFKKFIEKENEKEKKELVEVDKITNIKGGVEDEKCI